MRWIWLSFPWLLPVTSRFEASRIHVRLGFRRRILQHRLIAHISVQPSLVLGFESSHSSAHHFSDSKFLLTRFNSQCYRTHKRKERRRNRIENSPDWSFDWRQTLVIMLDGITFDESVVINAWRCSELLPFLLMEDWMQDLSNLLLCEKMDEERIQKSVGNLFDSSWRTELRRDGYSSNDNGFTGNYSSLLFLFRPSSSISLLLEPFCNCCVMVLVGALREWIERIRACVKMQGDPKTNPPRWTTGSGFIAHDLTEKLYSVNPSPS